MSFKKEFGLIMIGAIIFTASFLWKDLILDIEDLYFPKQKSMLNRLIFTIIVTIVLVLIAVQLKDCLGLSQPPDPADPENKISNRDNLDYNNPTDIETQIHNPIYGIHGLNNHLNIVHDNQV